MRTELCLQVPGQCMTLMFALLTVYDGKYISNLMLALLLVYDGN